MRVASCTFAALLAAGALPACVDDGPVDDDLDTQASALLGGASPLADYELGDAVRITRIRAVDADDPGAQRGWSGDVVATKAVGDLGLTIDPVAFGAPAGIGPVYLTGTAIDPTTLRLTALVSPPPGQSTLHYDGQTSIEQVSIDVTLRAEWIPAGQQGDCRWSGCTNVRFAVVPGSRVVARLSIETIPGWGVTAVTRTVTALPVALDATGGLAHPRTNRIELQRGSGSYTTGLTRLCTSTRARSVYGAITVDRPAREHGLTVPLHSTNPALRPSGASIVAGRTSGMFWMSVPAGWSGTTRLIADDGSWHGIDLEIAPCVARTDPFPVQPLNAPVDLLVIPRPGCLSCVVGDLSSRGEAVVLTSTGPVAYRPEVGAWKALPAPSGLSFDRLLIDDLGHVVTGGRTATGKLEATLLERDDGGWQPRYLGAFQPRVVEGTVAAGADLAGAPAWAVRFGAAVAAPPLAQLAGPITAIADQTVAVDVAGTDLAIDLATGASTSLGTAAEKVSVTGGDGHTRLIGTARNSAGKDRAYIWDLATSQRKPLGVLSGTSTSWPVAINELGWVVGLSGTKPFLYRPEAGMQALQALVDPAAGVVVVEPLAITDNAQVLVAGRSGGVLGLYTITLLP